MAAFLARRRFSPNLISILGMIAACVAGALLAFSGRPLAVGIGAEGANGAVRVALVVAAVLVQARLMANLLDGMVAVEGGMRSPVGDLYNEVPDRVSDTVILIGAGYGAGAAPVLGYLGATLAMFVTYIRALGKASGFPSDFRGPMAKQERMFIVTVCALYVGLTPASWQPNFWPREDGTALGVLGGGLIVIVLGCVATAARRLLTLSAALRARGL